MHDAAFQYAMSNSVNPKTHSSYGTPAYSNPYVGLASQTMSESIEEVLLHIYCIVSFSWFIFTHIQRRRQEAARITSGIANSHLNAVARASPGVKIGNSSFKIPFSISRPVNKYRILVGSFEVHSLS